MLFRAFAISVRGRKEKLVLLSFCWLFGDRNGYRIESNFLAFMSIICTILKNDMFSDKKYI